MRNDILNLQTKAVFDNSISRIEYRIHQPYVTNAYGSSDEIRIAIQQQDSRTYIHDSFIYIEGKITPGNNAQNEPALYTLNKNAFSHLFEEIRYELSGQVVDKMRNVGITSTMKGYVLFNKTEANIKLYHEDFQVNDDGTFSVYLPLDLFLGFAEFYKKIIVNAKHELVLLRAKNDSGLFNSALQPKVELMKIQWHVPHVNVNDAERLELLKILDSNFSIQVPFRSYDLHECPVQPNVRKQAWTVRTAMQMEKPRFVIVGFQTDRKKINADCSVFDHCNITDVKLFLNSEIYPYTAFNADFTKNMFDLMYNSYVSMRPSCTGKPIDPLFSRKQYKEIAPLVVIDCSKQIESVKSSAVDIKIEFETDIPFPANTIIYCMIVHDRVFEYNPTTSLVKILV